MKNYLLFLFICFFSISPSFGMARKNDSKQQAISQGVYGSSEAITKGRVDLADSILIDTKRLVPPPKKPLKISEVKGQVILPEKLKGEVVKANSPEFKALTADKTARKALQSGEKVKATFTKSVDKEIRRDVVADAKLQADLAKANQTIAEKNKKIAHLSGYRNLVWSVVLGIAALVAVYILSLFIRLGISTFRMF